MQAMSQIGDRGVVWILLGVFLIARDKTRPAGVALLLALLCAHLLGNEVLKPSSTAPARATCTPGSCISSPGRGARPSPRAIPLPPLPRPWRWLSSATGRGRWR